MNRHEKRDQHPQLDKEFSDPNSQKMLNLLFGIFLAVGLISLTAAVISGFQAASRLAREISTTGVIVTLISRIDSDGDEYFYPLVEYKLPDGSEKRVEMSEGSSPPAYRQGQTVTVLYDPENPNRARIQSFGGFIDLWIVPLITGFLGVIFTGVAILTRKVFE